MNHCYESGVCESTARATDSKNLELPHCAACVTALIVLCSLHTSALCIVLFMLPAQQAADGNAILSRHCFLDVSTQ